MASQPTDAPPTARTQRAREWVAGSETGLATLALLVGLGAGLGAIAFRFLILGVTLLFTGHRDYAATPGAGNPHLPFGAWFVVGAPVVGGLVYGPLVARFAPEARGHGVPEVMLAVARRGGRIRPQVPAVKALASALTIGSGGSVGREGPIVQIGSALGSVLGQASHVSEDRLRLLVACGAAGAISATFNAPIAGVFFALEVILRDFNARAFGFVVLSAVVAGAVSRAVVGSEAFLTLPSFHQASVLEYGLYVVLGVLAALVGIAFVRVLYAGEDLADRLWRGPEWLRPAAGGLVLGLLLLVVPQMYGVGYPVLEGAIEGHYVVLALLGLLLAKIVATSLTLAIGGSGGVFAPSLFMGAMLGSAFGAAAHAALPGLTAPAGAYGLIGMGAVFAASAQAPITAVLIIFELTGEYSIILPLMFAIALATGVSHAITGETTIYTLKLRRRGIDVDAVDPLPMRDVTLAEAMLPVPAALPRGTTMAQAAHRLAAPGGDGALPVLDEDGELLGVLTSRDVARALEERGPTASVDELVHVVAPLHAGDPLERASTALARTDDPGLPVLAADGSRRPVGWIDHRAVLGAYERALSEAAADGTPAA